MAVLGGGGLGSYDLSTYGGAAGDLLGQQVQDETEEMKRRKAMLKQMQEAVSPLGATASLGLSGTSRPLGMGYRANRGG